MNKPSVTIPVNAGVVYIPLAEYDRLKAAELALENLNKQDNPMYVLYKDNAYICAAPEGLAKYIEESLKTDLRKVTYQLNAVEGENACLRVSLRKYTDTVPLPRKPSTDKCWWLKWFK